MFSKRIDLFSLLGFRVSLDLSWFILAVLIVWSLAEGYFPQVVEGIDARAAFWMGIGGALGLFASIIFHEFSHAIIARRFDIPIAGITLFIFGGVAEMKEEPPNARSEFYMAIAGPIASYILAAAFWGVAQALPPATAEAPVQALFSYLALINVVLATFNLIPAFPLDGGRVFRAAMWGWTGDLQRATRYGATAGRVFGGFLIALGALSIVAGNFVGGMWQALIGFFIIAAASSTEMRMTLQKQLSDLPVRNIMARQPVTVPAETTVEDLIEDYFYRYNHKLFPVVRNDRFVGSVKIDDVGKIARDDRARQTAGDILRDDSEVRRITPDTPVLDALNRMQEQNTSRLVVTDGDKPVGIVTMRDVMTCLAIRREVDTGPARS